MRTEEACSKFIKTYKLLLPKLTKEGNLPNFCYRNFPRLLLPKNLLPKLLLPKRTEDVLANAIDDGNLNALCI